MRGKIRKTESYRSLWALVLTLMVGILLTSAQPQQKQPEQPNDNAQLWKAVQDAMGRPGELQSDGVFKFSMPRRDLKVRVEGIDIKPGLALGSWAAFMPMGNRAMLMGDLVLTEDEVSPVMRRLVEGGLEITALHNHVLRESPRVMYMHIGGLGDPAKIAQTIKAALEMTKPPGPEAGATQLTSEIELDTARIEQMLGHKGKVKGGLFQVSVPRAKPPRMLMGNNTVGIPGSMGVATAINFQPTGNGRAAITGDFVLVAGEVNPVIRALRQNGIEITALHSHMLDETPRLFFMHFWANEDAVKLARGLRAALDLTGSRKAK